MRRNEMEKKWKRNGNEMEKNERNGIGKEQNEWKSGEHGENGKNGRKGWNNENGERGKKPKMREGIESNKDIEGKKAPEIAHEETNEVSEMVAVDLLEQNNTLRTVATRLHSHFVVRRRTFHLRPETK